MKILLINPLDRDFMPPAMPPLGIAYISTVLNRLGHAVTIIDLNANRENGLSVLRDTLLKERFGLIGISSIITQYKKVKALGKFIKSSAPSTLLLMGGTGPSSTPEMYLKNCYADIVCIGEGEEIIDNLLATIEGGGILDKCQGIAFKTSDGSIVKTPKVDKPVDVNQLDFPRWDTFHSIDTYMDNYLFKNGRKKGMSILSSRGCPGCCNFCLCNFGRKIRCRSAENIFKEIAYLVENYKVDHIHFVDDTLITTEDRIKDISNCFNAFKDLTWSANARVNLVNANMLKMMAKANCISLAFGIESGSPKVLKYMRKGITPQQASTAIKLTREAGISLRTYFMIGMPCETEETIEETVNFCKDNLVGGEFFFATPFPATPLYDYAKENGFLHDEDVYLECVGEVRDFVINMTRMDNERLFTLKENAEEEIKGHLKKHGIFVKASFKKDPRETAKNLPEF